MAKKQIRKPRRKITTPKDCAFCKEGKEVSYLEPEVLRKYLTERGKIIGRARSGLCSKHQKRLTVAIKQARHLALMPFTPHHR